MTVSYSLNSAVDAYIDGDVCAHDLVAMRCPMSDQYLIILYYSLRPMTFFYF